MNEMADLIRCSMHSPATELDGHAHHHTEEGGTPTHTAHAGTCWHCLWGHLGPGSFIVWLGVLLFLEAMTTRRRKRSVISKAQVERLRVVVAMVGGSVMLLGELRTHSHWSWASLQHMTMYGMVLMDGLWTEAKIRGIITAPYLAVWEVGSLTCMGMQMANHNHGGLLMLGMHKMMHPVLLLIGAVLVLDRFWAPSRLDTREGLRLAGSVLLSMLGMWFMSIGTGFWLWGDHGLLGTAHGDIDMADAGMEITGYLTVHFILAFTLVSLAWLIVNSRYPPCETDKKLDQDRNATLELTPLDARGAGGRRKVLSPAADGRADYAEVTREEDESEDEEVYTQNVLV